MRPMVRAAMRLVKRNDRHLTPATQAWYKPFGDIHPRLLRRDDQDVIYHRVSSSLPIQLVSKPTFSAINETMTYER